VFSGPPVLRINDQIPNRPRFVVDDEIRDVTDLSIQRLDVIAAHGLSTAQMRIALFLTVSGIATRFGPSFALASWVSERPHMYGPAKYIGQP